MDIQDLGSIGELIAALATVVTLVYLATQIRQNTNQLKGEAIREINNTEQDLVHRIRDNPEMFSTLMRALIDWHGVDAKEQARTHLYLYSYTRWLETCWNLQEQKALDKKIYDSRELFIVGIIGNPKGGRVWWEMWKELYDPDFVAHLDSALDNYESSGSYVLKAPFYAPEHWVKENPPNKAMESDT